MPTKKLSDDMQDALKAPLPDEAIKPHPTKPYLSSINAIYVTERLNDVFGTGNWKTEVEVIDSESKMVTVKLVFTVAEYEIHLEQFGGNDNSDKGDALKGAMTDAMTKIGSYLGIGVDVWKDKQKPSAAAGTTKEAYTQKDDNKEWYSQKNFEHQKEALMQHLNDGMTPLDIMKKLRNTYKVAKKWEMEIAALTQESSPQYIEATTDEEDPF